LRRKERPDLSRGAGDPIFRNAHAVAGAAGAFPLDSWSDLDCGEGLYVDQPQSLSAQPHFRLQTSLRHFSGTKASLTRGHTFAVVLA